MKKVGFQSVGWVKQIFIDKIHIEMFLSNLLCLIFFFHVAAPSV